MFEFELRREFGNRRYYPVNPSAIALMVIARRAILKEQDIQVMKTAGWPLKIHDIPLHIS